MCISCTFLSCVTITIELINSKGILNLTIIGGHSFSLIEDGGDGHLFSTTFALLRLRIHQKQSSNYINHAACVELMTLIISRYSKFFIVINYIQLKVFTLSSARQKSHNTDLLCFSKNLFSLIIIKAYAQINYINEINWTIKLIIISNILY